MCSSIVSSISDKAKKGLISLTPGVLQKSIWRVKFFDLAVIQNQDLVAVHDCFQPARVIGIFGTLLYNANQNLNKDIHLFLILGRYQVLYKFKMNNK